MDSTDFERAVAKGLARLLQGAGAMAWPGPVPATLHRVRQDDTAVRLEVNGLPVVVSVAVGA